MRSQTRRRSALARRLPNAAECGSTIGRYEGISVSMAEPSELQPASAEPPASWQIDMPAEEPEPSAPPPLGHILEALLFVGGRPLTAERAGAAVRGLTPEQFMEAIAGLNREYRRQGRPYTILAREHGYVLTLRPRFKD